MTASALAVPRLPPVDPALLAQHGAAHAGDGPGDGEGPRSVLERWTIAQTTDGLAGLTPAFTGTVAPGVAVDPGVFPPPRAFVSPSQRRRVERAADGLAWVQERRRRAADERSPLIDAGLLPVLHAVVGAGEPAERGRYRSGPSAWSSRHNPYAPTDPDAIEGVVAGIATTAAAALVDGVAPVVVGAWASFATVACHPFADGNGRIARLVYLLLASAPETTIDGGAIEVMARHRPLHVAAVTAGEAGVARWDADGLDAGPFTDAMIRFSIAGAQTRRHRLARLEAADARLTEVIPDQVLRAAVLWTWIRRMATRFDPGVDPDSLEVLTSAGALERHPIPASRRIPGAGGVGYRLGADLAPMLGPPGTPAGA